MYLSASLKGGVEGYLSRRSSCFRSNLRRDLRRAGEADVVMKAVTPANEAEARNAFERLLAIEKHSHKADSELSPFRHEDHARFYRDLLISTAMKGRLRMLVAQRDGEDVAYIFGAIMGNTYRGFQMSYVNKYRALGLGNVMQYRMIEMLCAEGIRVYDMGMDMEYKRKWAEEVIELNNLLVVGRGLSLGTSRN